MKLILLFAAVTGLALTARPVELPVWQLPLPNYQDNWVIPDRVDELGVLPAFPADEALAAWDLGQVAYQPCPIEFAPLGPPNLLVRIQNLTQKAYKDVWYVGDVGTLFTNFDELVGAAGGPRWFAMKIDYAGVNVPLVREDNVNGIWEPMEKWDFVLQNYGSLWGPPALLGSIGIAGQSMPDFVSSGSILVPEPGWGFAAMALAALGGAAVIRRRSS